MTEEVKIQLPQNESSHESNDASTPENHSESSEENIDDIANSVLDKKQEDAGSGDESEEKSSFEDIPLPEDDEDKKLTKEDYILRRKEKQLLREKRAAIAAKDEELSRIKAERDQESQRAAMLEIKNVRAPDRDDFESEQEYLTANFNYNLGIRQIHAAQAAEQEYKTQQRQERISKLEDAEEIGREKYPHFEEAVSALTQPGALTNHALVDAVIESDFSADLLYMLGKHPEARKKLNNMSPIQAVKEVAKLEMRFKEAKMTKTKSAVKPLDQLKSKPISNDKVEPGKSLTPDMQKKMSKLSPKEFEKAMDEHLKSPATRGF